MAKAAYPKRPTVSTATRQGKKPPVSMLLLCFTDHRADRRFHHPTCSEIPNT